MLDVLVLGPVRAESDGTSHRIGGTKQAALLALLVETANNPCTPERLIDEVWGEALPRDPNHALQARISRLRSTLGVEIAFDDGGYRIDPTTVRVDAVRFEQLVDQARWFRADGDLERSATCLREALGFWHGRAFENVSDVRSLAAEAVRLNGIRETARADRIDTDLALGRVEPIIAELEALVEEHPFVERTWGQLMTALYCDARPLEALQVFERARNWFVEAVGCEPSSELSRLHGAMLQDRPCESLLRWQPVPLAQDQQPATLPPVLEAAAISSQPDELAALIRDRRALILTGPAGIGKTHLLNRVRSALEARNRSAPMVTADALSREVPLGVFAGLVSVDSATRSLPKALIAHFASQPSLPVLLVDNVDDLDDGSLFVVTQLIGACGMQTVLTSRALTGTPEAIRALYDRGNLTEVAVQGLSDSDAAEVVADVLGGPPTPAALAPLLEAAGGNPLQLRELLFGSLDAGRLVESAHGWELHGDPVPTLRLAQLADERFDRLDPDCLEAATTVAIAGAYPSEAIETNARRMLARAGVLESAGTGWVQLSGPLDREHLRFRVAPLVWDELTRNVIEILTGPLARSRPEAVRRARILALEVGDLVESSELVELAEFALGAFDEHLARRAAQAAIAQSPRRSSAYRVAGSASASLGDHDSATEYFKSALELAESAEDHTTAVLARAEHLGLACDDAPGALATIAAAQRTIEDPGALERLSQARMRWAIVAGKGDTIDPDMAAADTTDVAGLLTVAMTAVLSGPMAAAEDALSRLRDAPGDEVALMPGAGSLIDLARIMALSNSGDVVATRRELTRAIDHATRETPEMLGAWEYALAFADLFSADVTHAHRVARRAADHLAWRDPAGLWPAATALVCASASVLGRSGDAEVAFDAVPETAAEDPKVVMLQAWARAYDAHRADRPDQAAAVLVDTAQWLLDVRHTYFAGMLAHCAVREGTRAADALTVAEQARQIGGGGLLEVFARHGEATVTDDAAQLDLIATQARELGMVSTATDSWLRLDQRDGAHPECRTAARELQREYRSMALWGVPPRS